jgi:hypothetical protein
MFLRKISAALAVIALLLISRDFAVSGEGFTASVTQNPETGVISISGGNASGKAHRIVNLKIFAPNSTASDGPVYILPAETVSGGGFAFGNFTLSAGTGAYTYTIASDGETVSGTLNYVDIETQSELRLRANGFIKEGDTDALMALCENNLENLGFLLPEDIAPASRRKIYEWVAAQGEAPGAVVFTENYFTGALKQAIVESAETEAASELIKKYGERLDFGANTTYPAFLTMCAAGKAVNATSALKNSKALKTAGFQKEFSESVLLGAVLHMNWGSLHNIITADSVLLNINLSDYNKVAETVERAVTGKSYESLSALSSALNGEVAGALSALNSSTGRNGSGSPTSGGGGGYPVEIPKDAEHPGGEDTNVPFSDLNSAVWAREAILGLYEKGVVDGKGGGLFAPGDSVTREEFIKMAVIAFGIGESYVNCPFEDVSEADWYFSYVSSAYTKGIARGADNIFGVGQRIIRQDMAALLYRIFEAAEKSLNDGAVSFTDGDEISEYAIDAVGAFFAEGIINGVGGGRFNPRGFATRAEAAKIIFESLKVFFR